MQTTMYTQGGVDVYMSKMKRFLSLALVLTLLLYSSAG